MITVTQYGLLGVFQLVHQALWLIKKKQESTPSARTAHSTPLALGRSSGWIIEQGIGT